MICLNNVSIHLNPQKVCTKIYLGLTWGEVTLQFDIRRQFDCAKGN